ncbi:gamma carbonic anhydrase family protein [Alteromonas aestuariivivens]|uniref:Gamma carbonic anhydrase family protein n=1 Tax=Alteromonas aestuariivivens TaxID=1938339 RepID=A0A3D8M9J7_9ALTE|nr:gamma carbonic anhydrase family protein [Alteromonas aestuariivivens]RDV25980.1 gamma carbonic anhydrase family protein [Alteromonas aestuariivivens]
MLYQFGEHAPRLGTNVYLAPGSQVIGRVDLADNVSVWFNTVIRGDTDQILIGANTNVQDGCVLHTDSGYTLKLGEGVTVGHKAMLHGCEVGDFSLVGINAVILNGARIGRYCVIGANTLIPENMQIPDYSLVVGSPGKVIRTLDEGAAEKLEMSARHYVENGRKFRQQLKALPYEDMEA